MSAVCYHRVETPDGWVLPVQVRSRADATGVPVLVVPGYGMNSHLFRNSPMGPSLSEFLCDAGHPVWTVDLRGQGGSRPTRDTSHEPTLQHQITQDVSSVVAYARRIHAQQKLALFGCSLGGSIALAHVALNGDDGLAGVITVGSPLTWEGVHPLLRAMGSSRLVSEFLRPRGLRDFAERAAPLLRIAPQALSPYLNVDNIDLDVLPQLIQTIEDPLPGVNRDIAQWLKSGKLHVEGLDVADAIGNATVPLLTVLANRDGIVPTASAASALTRWGGPTTRLDVGDEERWYAHADLFVGRYANRDVFAPIRDWLAALDD
jgi:pimeloyl-ACP methyl ester carboxylesterase